MDEKKKITYETLLKTFGKVYKKKINIVNGLDNNQTCGLIIQTLPSTQLKITLIVNPTSVYEVYYNEKNIETLKSAFGFKKTTVDLFLKHVIYSINATAQVEIESDNNDSSADNIAKIILKHYVADICISASISVPKGDEKTYYELLMEIINTEENQDDIEEISAKLSHSSSHNSNSNGYNNNNNDNVSRESSHNSTNGSISRNVSYNSNSSQSLSYNLSSQSSQGSPTSKKRKSKSKFRPRIKRHKRG